MKKQFISALCVLGLATLSSMAVPTPPPTVDCSDSATVGNVVGGGTDGYDDCEGWISGNVNGSSSELDELALYFGGLPTDWTYQGKSDDASNGPFTGGSGATSGTLTFDSPIFSTFVIGIKGGPDYSYYLFDANALGIESIAFDTLGIVTGGGSAGPGLSHIALYTTDTSNVPDGGSAMMLLGMGLMGLSFVRRRMQ